MISRFQPTTLSQTDREGVGQDQVPCAKRPLNFDMKIATLKSYRSEEELVPPPERIVHAVQSLNGSGSGAIGKSRV